MLSRRFLTERSHAQQCVVQQCVERSVGSCTTHTPDISLYIFIYLFLRRASHFEVSKHVGWSIEAFLTNLNIIFDIPIVLKTLKSSSHVFVTSSLCTYWDSCFSMNIQTIAWHLDDIETLFNISFFYFETFSPTLINTKSPSLHWSEGTHAQRMVKKLRDFRYSIEQARASSPNSSW